MVRRLEDDRVSMAVTKGGKDMENTHRNKIYFKSQCVFCSFFFNFYKTLYQALYQAQLILNYFIYFKQYFKGLANEIILNKLDTTSN